MSNTALFLGATLISTSCLNVWVWVKDKDEAIYEPSYFLFSPSIKGVSLLRDRNTLWEGNVSFIYK